MRPWMIALEGDSLWLLAGDDSEVLRLNAETGDMVATIAVSEPRRIAFGFDAVWVASGIKGNLDWIAAGGPFLTRIDPATHQVVALIPIEGGASDVVVAADAVWTSSTSGPISKIDPLTNEVVDTLPVNKVQFMTTDGNPSG